MRRFSTAILMALVMLGSVSAQNMVHKFPHLLQTIDHYVFKDGTFTISKEFEDDHNGVWHAYGFQTFNGLEIDGANFGAHVQNGVVVSYNHSFVEKSMLQAPDHQMNRDAAFTAFLNTLSVNSKSANTQLNWTETAANEYELRDSSLSPEVIRIKKTYVQNGNALEPSWSVSMLLPNESHWYYTIISATTGEVMRQYDWMLSCAPSGSHKHSVSVTTKGAVPGYTANKRGGDGAKYNAFPIGVESPNHGNRVILENIADTLASPYGWQDINGKEGAEYTITQGNNVLAREDRDNNNSGGYSPDGGSTLNFDFPFGKNANNNSNLDAAITNLFVWNNFMHDVWYHYGFDEKSGNFQTNNYGRSSTGAGDYVFADAQDGGGTDNANFATPTDGSNPRMQMYLWGTSSGTIAVDVYSPSSSAGTFAVTASKFGPALGKDPIKAQLVLVNDGSSTPTVGCNELQNATDLNGKIALIERGGSCNYVDKVRNAQKAGALAVMIYTDYRAVTEMDGDGTESDITIPSVMIQRSLGLSLKNESLSKSFEVALYDSSATSGLDGDFDNGVIAHEYTHGISTRLTGGAMNSNCLQSYEQMGEGWSDFFCLVMTQQADDKGSDVRGIGTYLKREGVNGNGIRPYPYTTDLSKSLYKYTDIGKYAESHGIGAVWCAMLWDMYWAFIDQYGYDPDIYNGTGGNNIAVQLVIDGLKLQPCNPGFIDGRDAILLADKLNNGGKNEKLIWTAFAKRGLGWDADGGDVNNINDGKNGFQIPPKFRGFVQIEKTALEQINEKDQLDYTIKITNLADESYTNVEVVDTIPTQLVFDPASSDCKWTVNGNILSMTIDELPAGNSIECHYSTKPKPGAYTQVNVSDGAEQAGGRWTTQSDVGSDTWNIQTTTKAEGNACWFVRNSFSNSDQSLIFTIGTVHAGEILSFQQYYNTNTGRDGGVVEFTEDGTNWIDAKDMFVKNGYNNQVVNNNTTPLNGRSLFSGNSGGFITTVVNLDAFAGKEISVRFRFVTDRYFSGIGWYVDDLKVMKYVSVTNTVWGINKGNAASAQIETVVYDTDPSNGISPAAETKKIAVVFPNPAGTFTRVIIDQPNTEAVLRILDINGKELMQQKVLTGSNEVVVSQLAKGTYILTIECNGQLDRHRLIKL